MVTLPPGSVSAKVWQASSSGQRTAVSHLHKATKGEIARVLATAEDEPRSGEDLVALLRREGWQADLSDGRLDVLMA